MARILVIGGSGYVGSNLVLFARRSRQFDVWSTCFKSGRSSPSNIRVDITDGDAVRDLLTQIKPEVVVHAAAMTNGDFCSENRETAWRVNVMGARNIASSVSEIGGRLVYISTDQVYSGDRPFASEDDVPSPVCFYGQTKLEAERMVASICSNYCIARTSLIYGLSKTCRRTLFDRLVGNLLADKQTPLFDDEYRSPIFLDNYCAILMELTGKAGVQGVFNVCGDERISRYELGEHLALALSKEKSLLIRASVRDFGFIDNRPKDCSMSNSLLASTLSTEIVGIRDACAAMRCRLPRSDSEETAR